MLKDSEIYLKSMQSFTSNESIYADVYANSTFLDLMY